jgi:hypothetical protein
LTKDELYQLLGHQDIERDLDVKTLVMDLIRSKLTPDELMALMLDHLEDLDEAFVRGYLYRRFSS